MEQIKRPDAIVCEVCGRAMENDRYPYCSAICRDIYLIEKGKKVATQD